MSAATKTRPIPQVNPGPNSGQPNLVRLVLIDSKSQAYGPKYLTAIRDVGAVMESYANYLRYA